jgi:hypothetical protein
MIVNETQKRFDVEIFRHDAFDLMCIMPPKKPSKGFTSINIKNAETHLIERLRETYLEVVTEIHNQDLQLAYELQVDESGTEVEPDGEKEEDNLASSNISATCSSNINDSSINTEEFVPVIPPL